MLKRIITIMILTMMGSLPIRAEENAKLFFAYSPGCPHCEYQKPIINRFTQKHPGVRLTRAQYASLNAHQRKLIEGTSGHPVMVFYKGNCIRQVVGETSLKELEEEYAAFKEECSGPEKSKTVTTGSGVVCH